MDTGERWCIAQRKAPRLSLAQIYYERLIISEAVGLVSDDEFLVDDPKRTNQDLPPGARVRCGDDQQFDRLVGEFVKTRVLAAHGDDLDDNREHRHAEHERGKHQMHFGNLQCDMRTDERKIAMNRFRSQCAAL